MLTRMDAYLLFKTQKDKVARATCDEVDVMIAQQKSKRQTRIVVQTVALTTTPGLVSVLTSILLFCSMLVTEEPLKASGSAQLSSCLVYQDLGCPLALQTKAYVYRPFITSLQYSLHYFSFLICIDRWS